MNNASEVLTAKVRAMQARDCAKMITKQCRSAAAQNWTQEEWKTAEWAINEYNAEAKRQAALARRLMKSA